MKCKLSDICAFRKGKVDVSKLTLKTYISTENMLPNKGGITGASSLPAIPLTQEYKKEMFLFLILDHILRKYGELSMMVVVQMTF